MTSSYTCRICENVTGNVPSEPREMLYGYWEPFTYFVCGQCGCLQISSQLDPGVGYEKYYLEPVYRDVPSRDTAEEVFGLSIPTWLVTMLGGPVLSYREVFGEQERKQDAWEADIVERVVRSYLGGFDVDPGWSVLDVGTSEGSFLVSLRKAGFRGRLLGIDPMIREDIHYADHDVRVERAEIGDLDSSTKWDLVTFHHSLACIPEPGLALRKAAELLSDRGVCLVRTHVVPNYCWKQYGIHWIGIDPPRNLFLYSPMALDLLAERAGLTVARPPKYDSGSFQFWGSEQAKRCIALYAEDSFAVNPYGSTVPVLSRMDVYEKTAHALNASGAGDMAAFLLTLS